MRSETMAKVLLGVGDTFEPRRAHTLKVGEKVLVEAGDLVPGDGEIIEGVATIDESAITGESVPVEAGPGSDVFAGSINGTGVLEVEVTSSAADNSLARIVAIVEAEQSRTGASQRLADRIAKPLVPAIMVAAALIAAIARRAQELLDYVRFLHAAREK